MSVSLNALGLFLDFAFFAVSIWKVVAPQLTLKRRLLKSSVDV